MLSNQFLQLALLAAVGLQKLVLAGADPSPVYGNIGQQALYQQPAVANTTEEIEQLMEECDESITACAATAKNKVISTYTSTIYTTNIHVHEEVTTISTSTRTYTEVEVSTETTTTEGQCRETEFVQAPIPQIVTVDVNTTTTREYVHITSTTTKVLSVVKYKQTAQCIVRKKSTGLAPFPPSAPTANPPGYGSNPSQPHSNEPTSRQVPPASSPSGFASDSSQPARSEPPSHPSSGRGGGRPRYVPVDKNFIPILKEPRRRRANSEPSSSTPTPSSVSTVAFGSASGASSSTLSTGP
ncbi:hypothetical protein MRS44_003732 [Fusarium solani]|uniref:uncharacterized protein n=1 Tax=Fusarium solani TaxID=169388 RepID=UPI0032C3E8DB|nr:hypothetical protein MRS44_003732 [Fusarium solani]